MGIWLIHVDYLCSKILIYEHIREGVIVTDYVQTV